MLHPAIGYLVTVLGARLERARNEKGASAVEWVVIAAVLVTLCVAIGAILTGALQGEANDIGDRIQNAG